MWIDDLAKCGQMKDWNRDTAPDATQFPLPPVSTRLQNSLASLDILTPSPLSSCLRITSRSFLYALLCLWNYHCFSLSSSSQSLYLWSLFSSYLCCIDFLCWFSFLMIHNSLNLGLKPTFFINPSTVFTDSMDYHPDPVLKLFKNSWGSRAP